MSTTREQRRNRRAEAERDLRRARIEMADLVATIFQDDTPLPRRHQDTREEILESIAGTALTSAFGGYDPTADIEEHIEMLADRGLASGAEVEALREKMVDFEMYRDELDEAINAGRAAR